MHVSRRCLPVQWQQLGLLLRRFPEVDVDDVRIMVGEAPPFGHGGHVMNGSHWLWERDVVDAEEAGYSMRQGTSGNVQSQLQAGAVQACTPLTAAAPVLPL
jgi:hypothetical protein